jgi:RNA polymerase sigma factor (TIGR02999 family)
MANPEVTTLLESIKSGDARAFESLVALVYGELRRIAASLMRNERSGHTLQPTALVNEAFVKLVQSDTQFENRAHFFGAAARAMRQVLIGYARQRAAQKRGCGMQVTFHDLQVQTEEPNVDMLALDEALRALERVNPRLVEVIELRYFAGCPLEQVAEITGRSIATLKRDWAYARAWLHERMSSTR